MLRVCRHAELVRSNRLPAFLSVRDPQPVHPLPESIGVNPRNLRGPTRPIDLAAGSLQGLPDVSYIQLLQREEGPIWAGIRSRLTALENRWGQ